MITLQQLKAILPNNKSPQLLLDALNTILPKYNINTKERIACFLAQCGHESGEFNILKENLNYTDKSLCTIWPKRFPSLKVAAPYNRNPEKIANKIYADRMGNGNELSGDGYKFRGRGCIQMTGKENYTKFAKHIGKTLEETIVYCESIEGAIESGCYYWSTHNLNVFVDKKDFIGLTKAINGGVIGLEERKKHYDKAISVLYK